MDAPSEILLAQLMPEVAARARHMAFNLSREGIYIRIVQGLRSIDYQDSLFAQGRDAAGHVINPKAIVTRARGGQSYHNYGLAFDAVPSVNGLDIHYQPDWNASHPAWQRMEAEGKAFGLTAGADFHDFPDFPHFQLNGPWPIGKPPAYVRYLVINGNLQPVWERVTAFLKEPRHGNP